MSKDRQSKRSGYTLLELVVCVPLTTMLVIGLGASIHIATRVLPSSSTQSSAPLQATAIDRLASELAFATALTLCTPRN